MSIQRQYSLPNCVLILEGFSNATESATARPELSVLTRVECRFAREKESLVGGREFLEGLVHATNACVQSWISGLPSSTPVKSAEANAQVQLQPGQVGGFHLVVPNKLLFNPTTDPLTTETALASSVRELPISTLQLFDLMEAVDQLTADQQTLPDLKATVQPRSRREVRSPQVMVEQSAPIAVGAASVAIAAAAAFFMPVPKVSPPPKDPPLQPSGEQPGLIPPTAIPVSPGGSPAPSPSAPTTSGTETSAPAGQPPASSP